jgi:STE24 endopeptidase
LNESKATRYQRLRRRARVAGVAAGAGLLGLVAATPAADRLAGWSASVASGWPALLQPVITLAVFVAVLTVAAELVALPVAWYAATRVARRYTRADVSHDAVLLAQLRDACVGAVLAFTVAGVVRLSVWLTGGWWWAVSSVALAGMTLAAARFLGAGLTAAAGARPLARPALLARLSALGQRALGRPVDVREWLSDAATGATATVTGVGGTGHVWLSHEMARDWADDEIEVVVAHELSHHAHHDLSRKVALDAVLWGVALWVAGRVVPAADLASLPLIAVVAGTVWTLARPIRTAQSRAHERRADRFALALTGNAEAFGRALRRLGEQHLAEERPSHLTRWFFHDHPTVEDRLAQMKPD